MGARRATLAMAAALRALPAGSFTPAAASTTPTAGRWAANGTRVGATRSNTAAAHHRSQPHLQHSLHVHSTPTLAMPRGFLSSSSSYFHSSASRGAVGGGASH